MARYGLANHVFVCRDEEYIVVLDVRQDRYFAMEAARTASLSGLLPGWPAEPSNTGPGEGMQSTGDEVVAPLLGRGWLLELPAPSKEATPVRLAPPEADLLTDLTGDGAKIGIRAVIAFVIASIFARFALRFWRFERVIRRVARRRAQNPAASRPFDVARARQLVETFGRLRVFLFSHREKCLQDSLALLEFLARYAVFPGWVFGVRARPFVAHCWVQHENVVFNDTAEHVGSYTPIMVV
jgi:hypothetical protein